MRIRQLPKLVANQIAAGEVIERPASVVKELLENALDAEAKLINIDIACGGLTQIKISDDGRGIVAEDLPLAIAPHATSKINQLRDLQSIVTMGFRGEALASIASVSRLVMSSKTAEQKHAMQLSTEGGELFHVSPCARSQGTTVEVCDIFFNAPVRKKFLKPQRSEFQAIELIVKRFALSAPQIAMNLSHNGKQLLQLPAAGCDKTRLGRIRKLLGRTFIEKSCYLKVEHADLRLYGWIGNKDYQRSQNDKLWIYVNGRMLKDKLLNHAIKQAYESFLYPGRYPACLLYLDINSEEVDFNVHPTKHEVRFQQPRLVHDFISSQLQKALEAADYKIKLPSLDQETYKTKLFQVHESSLALPAVSRLSNWISLNHAFALVLLQQGAYLVDVLAIQREWLFSQLIAKPLPLASRSLLVPLSYATQFLNPEAIHSYSLTLSQLGIELALGGENSLILRSLPQAVPHLDLKRFLAALLASPLPPIHKMLELLTHCQSFTVLQLQEEEIQTLIDYIQAFADDRLKNYCKHLSLEACRDILNA